jgi:hypothetical protein
LNESEQHSPHIWLTCLVDIYINTLDSFTYRRCSVYGRILSLLVFGVTTAAFADSASQTDWSGGPGVLGPVIELGNEFYIDTNIEWGTVPGNIVLQLVVEHTVDGEFSSASSVYCEDIDGDGDMDVLGSSYWLWDITWWENIDGSGTSWTKHLVDPAFNGARAVFSEDINGDGDMDILGAAQSDNVIAWWDNVNGTGTIWAKYTIDEDFDLAHSVYSEDVDGDGDMDVLGAAYVDDDITWWENADGSGTSWVEHTVDGDFDHASSVYSEDIDGDGDMDVLGAAASWYEGIAWWENVDGSGTSWIEHIVDGSFDLASSVFSEDIDGDGDMDILGASIYDDDITWWENIDGSGTSWIEHTIDGDFDGARSVYSEDVDNDGDMDVLGAAEWADDITWWENADGSGTSWTEHTVDSDFIGSRSVYSADVNGDGYMDVLGAASAVDDITWWDLTEYLPDGSLESSILDTQVNPDWDYLEWNSQTPSGTFVSFQVRASDDHTAMGAWSDTLSIPCLLQGILTDGDQYVQYRVILETSDPDSTPILFDLTLTWDPMGIEGGEEPAVLALLPFSPNPSSLPAVMFSLPEPASVDLAIFDLSGRLVSENHGEEYSPGYHDVLLDDLSPGIYFCRIISGDFKATQRFVVIE